MRNTSSGSLTNREDDYVYIYKSHFGDSIQNGLARPLIRCRESSVCELSHSVVSDSLWPWTIAHQAPLCMGFSRQEYSSGLPFPIPGGSTPSRDRTCVSWQAGSLSLMPPGGNLGKNNVALDQHSGSRLERLDRFGKQEAKLIELS